MIMKKLHFFLTLFMLSLLMITATNKTSATVVTVTLVDENGNPLANYPTGLNELSYQYRCGGTWVYSGAVQTDASGQFQTQDITCTNWDGKITVTLNQTSLEKVVTDNSATFQAAKVNVILKNCPETPLSGGTVEQGGGHWVTHGITGSDGTVSFYAFPGESVKVRMGYNYGSNTINSTTVVLPTTEIDYVTTKVTLAPGPVKVGVSGWPTVAMPLEMLPGTYSFRLNGTQINGVVISGCEVSKTLLRVKNELNQPVAGATFVPACGGSWQPQVAGATDANGNLFADIPACMTKIKAIVGSSVKELLKAQLIASNYIWVTEVLRMNFKDHAGNFITDGLGTIQSGGGWPTIGSFNSSGYFEVNSFPATTGFKATYNKTAQQKNFSIVAGAGIQEELFQTGKVVICDGQTQVNGSTFSGYEFMPGTYSFRHPTVTGIIVTAGAITYLPGCEPEKSAIIGDGVTPEFSYKLYPVPANSRLYVNITLVANEQVEFQVFDLTGRTMKNGTWKLNKGFNTNEIAVDDLVNGQYIFRLKSSDKVITEKFSIMK
jgi:hypothetical protein